jgi:hypothetical protein
MNKNITINQHYVPHALIKKFGWLSHKDIFKINIFDHKRGYTRYDQNIEKVFSSNYFYDRDNSVENFLNKIETPAAIVINELVKENFCILEIEERYSEIIIFISSLLCRTPKAKDRIIAFLDTHIKAKVSELLRLNGLDPHEAYKGEFKVKDHSQLISYITMNGVVNSLLIKDLDFHIIKNETQLEFCISDNPVFAYNWFYRDLEHPEVTNIAARGFQIFLPLSPNITLGLYDSDVYKYGQKKERVTHVYDVTDIQMMNSFQIINSESIIGFNKREGEAVLKRLYEVNKKIKLHQPESSILETIQNKEEIKSTHLTLTKQTKLKKMPSFIKIRKKSKINSNSFSYRDPELIAQFKHRKLL